MTNKEFFIKIITAEEPAFEKVLKAIPKGKLDFKPHERARTAGSLASQLASQPFFISAIVATGTSNWSDYPASKKSDPDELVAAMKKNFVGLKKALASASDRGWENDAATLAFQGEKWETKKYDMAWGLLFDAIHHRGQLTTYLRAMGEKVPSVYGGSADERPPM